MSRPLLYALALSGALALPAPAVVAAAPPPPAPSGQFLPSVGDRDGDGLPDAADCAPDDPTRPARAGVDADCDGAPDSGVGPVAIAGPVDGGPDGGEQVASRPGAHTVHAGSVARRAVHGPVTQMRLRLGSAVAAFVPRHDRHGRRTFVFVARSNAGLTLTSRLDARHPKTHRASLPRGGAYVLRVPVGSARRLRLRITVVDAAGKRHRAVRTLRV